ncbi:MAG: hypothetical protein EPN40_03775 [Rhodanobacteraceae bacterium]|nr:MAG: hypothetical protein EPN40_03775 [Rhodanobacteraceae bacterium]
MGVGVTGTDPTDRLALAVMPGAMLLTGATHAGGAAGAGSPQSTPASSASSGEQAARKRHAPQILQSIVAQNISKFPDTNASDVSVHITGVRARQDEGKGSTITIRGLIQVETQLNGRAARYLLMADVIRNSVTTSCHP